MYKSLKTNGYETIISNEITKYHRYNHITVQVKNHGQTSQTSAEHHSMYISQSI